MTEQEQQQEETQESAWTLVFETENTHWGTLRLGRIATPHPFMELAMNPKEATRHNPRVFFPMHPETALDMAEAIVLAFGSDKLKEAFREGRKP